MKYKPFWLGLLAVALALGIAVAPGCASKTETADTPKAEAPAEKPVFDAAQAMIDAANDYFKSSPVPTIAAADLFNVVQSKDPGYQIVDLRSAEHYALGHIDGAINIPFAETYTDENLAKLDPNKKIVVVCYTGHTASQTNMMYNMLGFDTLSLKFGMSGWVADKAIVGLDIPPAVAAGATYPTVTAPTEATGGFGTPTIDGYEDLKSAIQGQAKAYFDAKKPPTIVPADVLTAVQSKDPGVQIISVRKAEDYAKGHIDGAINILWTDLADNLDKIDPNKKIIIYCYTGHTGGEAAQFLNLMGYDAYNMKFGMSGWQADPALGGAAGYDPAAVTAMPVVQ